MPNLPGWSYVEIPLDLDAAVTVTASIAATLPQQEPGKRIPGDMYHLEQIEQHEGILVWQIESSIDGVSWFTAAKGVLVRTEPNQVARISSPLGTKARLAWWTSVVVAEKSVRDGSTYKRDRCTYLSLCPFDHSTLIVADVVFNVIVRSI